jgi:hypothetical protein
MIHTKILPELIPIIFFHLTIQELAIVARVCKIWNKASEDISVWQIHIQQTFGKNYKLELNPGLSFTKSPKLFVKLALDLKNYSFNIRSIIPLEKLCALPELKLDRKRELGLEQYLPTSEKLSRGKGYINDKEYYFLILRYCLVINKGNDKSSSRKGHFYYYQEAANSEEYYWENSPVSLSIYQIGLLINNEKVNISEQKVIYLE